MSDERALILLSECAKYDNEALNLMIMLQSTKEFGEKDMLWSKVHYYIRELGRE